LLKWGNAISWRSSCFFQESLIKLIIWKDVFFIHKLLMPSDHAINVRNSYTCQICNLSQDHQSIGDVLPKDASINIRNNSTCYFFNWNFNSCISFVGAECRVHVCWITDLFTILLDNPVFERKDIWKINFTVLLDDGFADKLNFAVEKF